jgi:hypothetical protein
VHEEEIMCERRDSIILARIEAKDTLHRRRDCFVVLFLETNVMHSFFHGSGPFLRVSPLLSLPSLLSISLTVDDYDGIWEERHRREVMYSS